MENPYQTPQASYAPAPMTGAPGQMNPGIVQALRGTKGWVRFMAVLGFIMTALMILGGISLMALSSSTLMGGAAVGVGLVYLILGVVNLFIAIKLNQYASRIGDFLRAPNEMSLVTALEAQRGFWKLVGIMGIIILAIYVLAFVGGAMSAVFTR